MATKLTVGDRAPEFTLSSQTGQPVSLQDFRGKQPVVLYFYPKDDTPGCTAEACAFRDQYEVFQEAGAAVLGVSGDTAESHQRFASKYQLPFTLLSDVNNQVRKLYQVPATLGLLPGRVTYVIDREGGIRHIFNSQFNFMGHITESLAILKTLA